MRNECYGIFFFTSDPDLILFPDRWILCLLSFQFVGGFKEQLVSEVAFILLRYSCIPWFLSTSCRFLSALIARFNSFLITGHLIVYYKGLPSFATLSFLRMNIRY
jgi:hypothetical protein